LAPVVFAYTQTEPWNSAEDCWETAAAIRAVSENPLHPDHPMLAVPGHLSPRFTPYTVIWGSVMRAFGWDILTVMKLSAWLNFALFVTGLFRFAQSLNARKLFAPLLLLVMFICWGNGYTQSNAYHFWFFFYTLPHIAAPSFGLGFHALAELINFLATRARHSLALFVLLFSLVFLIHPITGLFVFVTAFALSVTEGNARRAVPALLAPIAAFAALLWWPYFDYPKVLFTGTKDTWYVTEMYSGQLRALGIALAGIPIAGYFLLKRKHAFEVIGLTLFSAGYLLSYALDIAIGERSLLFAVFFLHLCIALFVYEAICDRLDRSSSDHVSKKVRLGLCAVILISALAYRQHDVRMTGSLLISSTISRRHPQTLPERFGFLSQNISSRDLLMTDPYGGWILHALTGAKAVSHMHGNPLMTEDLTQREADAWRFMTGDLTLTERKVMLRQYGVTHILLDLTKPARYSPQLLRDMNEIANSVVVERDSVQLYRVLEHF